MREEIGPQPVDGSVGACQHGGTARALVAEGRRGPGGLDPVAGVVVAAVELSHVTTSL